MAHAAHELGYKSVFVPLADAPEAEPARAVHGDPAALLAQLAGAFPGLRACYLPLPEARRTLALLVVAKSRPEEGADLARAAAEAGVDVAVAVEGTAEEPLRLLVWRALSSIDPLRDVKVTGRRLAVDATVKGAEEGHPRAWPAEVSHPPEVRRKAEAVARELGLLG